MPDNADLARALAEPVELVLGGRRYAGWTEVTVTRALDAFSGSFELTLAGKAGEGQTAPIEIVAGARCEVRLGRETVINGWVDAVGGSLDAEAHRFTVTGRDRSADLVDCSAIHKPGSWRNVRLEAIGAELTKPFGVAIIAKVSTGDPIRRFALQQGETVQAALERLLRFRGLLMVPNAEGDLEIVTPDAASPVAVLAVGSNILAIDGGRDHRERFSDYIVKGQAAGDDDRSGKAVAQILGTARDAGVDRYRPMLVVAEEQSDGGSATTRARWEAGVRAGRSVAVDVTVAGWRSAAGAPLWRPNTRVTLRAAPVGFASAELLVVGVTFSRGEGGTTTRLALAPPEAWQQLAQKETGK